MKERFARFRKKDLIKMWRTLKAESGYRRVTGMSVGAMNTDCSLQHLMNVHEERTLEMKKRGMKCCQKKT